MTTRRLVVPLAWAVVGSLGWGAIHMVRQEVQAELNQQVVARAKLEAALTQQASEAQAYPLAKQHWARWTQEGRLRPLDWMAVDEQLAALARPTGALARWRFGAPRGVLPGNPLSLMGLPVTLEAEALSLDSLLAWLVQQNRLGRGTWGLESLDIRVADDGRLLLSAQLMYCTLGQRSP